MSDWKEIDMEAMLSGVIANAEMGGYHFINGGVPWNKRFAMFKHNYRIKQAMVDAGHESWLRGDPYAIADWSSIFTPIEDALWVDIRCAGIAMWPQFPVGRYFVDFGNPAARIAIECDGKAFHDVEKDAARDADLNRLGWTVLRIPGWRCKKEAPAFDFDMTDEEEDERRDFINNRTPSYEIAYARQLLAEVGA
jgi:very-short-patch-repair endonuclease